MRIVLALALTLTGAAAHAIELEGTDTWWAKRAKTKEGHATLGFAVPVASRGQVIGAVQIVCPRASPRGSFLEIPGSVYAVPPELKGKETRIIVQINSQFFAGFVDHTRYLVYFDDPRLPDGIRGVPAGTSVRAALKESKESLRFALGPRSANDLIIRFNRSSAVAADLFASLRSQGLQAVAYESIVDLCDRFTNAAPKSK